MIVKDVEPAGRVHCVDKAVIITYPNFVGRFRRWC